MTNFLTGIFLVLHGLVHLLYYGQSARRFELQPGLTWPDGSWVFSKLLGEQGTRRLAGIFCIIAAAGFVLGGAAVFFEQTWWQTVVIASASFSGLLYILFWDGKFKHLDTQGGVGLLIDAAILMAILAFQWPRFDF
jgi:hypothetical protein